MLQQSQKDASSNFPEQEFSPRKSRRHDISSYESPPNRQGDNSRSQKLDPSDGQDGRNSTLLLGDDSGVEKKEEVALVYNYTRMLEDPTGKLRMFKELHIFSILTSHLKDQ